MAESGDGSRKTSAVPGGRLSRLGRMARLATGIAGGMVAEGARPPRLADYTGVGPLKAFVMVTARRGGCSTTCTR